MGPRGKLVGVLAVLAAACSAADSGAPQPVTASAVAHDDTPSEAPMVGKPASAPTIGTTSTIAPPPLAAVEDAGASDAAPDVAPSSVTVPVLLFHEICPDACPATHTYGLSVAAFTSMMTMLRDKGYTTISIETYASFLQGTDVGLPAHPVLVTFDDGRADAYLGADPVLQDLGMRATNFLITASIGAQRGSFMSWTDVANAASSGRWDLQLHAHAGHVRVPVTADGGTGPFYAWRRLVDGGALETFDDWKVRAESDVVTGEAELAKHIPGFRSLSFAVPYGDYGQDYSNDPDIAPELRRYFDAHFAVWFTQPHIDPPFSGRGANREVFRFTIRQTTTNDALAAWLDRHSAP